MDAQSCLVRTSGWLLLVGSLAGAACAALIIAWPPEVPPSRYSYPFSSSSYVAAQSFFALRDASQVVGLVGLSALVWKRAGLATRLGLVGAALGMVVFAATELYALTAVDVAASSAQADRVSAAYTLPVLLFGVSAVLAGAGLARSRLLPGLLGRWVVLVVGLYLFVPLLPALFAPDVVGRVAIGGWLLVFAGIGVVMLRATAAPTARRAAVSA